MSGGSAAAAVIQMVRAHYARDDGAFAGVAMALARQSKDERIRRGIQGIVHQGFTRPASEEYRPNTLKQLPSPPAASRLLEVLKPISFPDLMLDPAVQEVLDEVLLELEYRDELAERNLRARNRLLFWGPPGNGKSSSGAAVARALGVPAYGVSLPGLIASYLGATGQNLGELFGAIRSDMVVVFDELDAIGAARGAAESGGAKEYNSIVNTLLTLLDRHERGVIIATTNRPDILDAALLRRFDEKIEFPAPNETQMRGLSTKLSKHYGVPIVDVRSCVNFDEVTKTVQREARRHVMAEILKDQEEEEEDGEEEDTE